MKYLFWGEAVKGGYDWKYLTMTKYLAQSSRLATFVMAAVRPVWLGWVSPNLQGDLDFDLLTNYPNSKFKYSNTKQLFTVLNPEREKQRTLYKIENISIFPLWKYTKKYSIYFTVLNINFIMWLHKINSKHQINFTKIWLWHQRDNLFQLKVWMSFIFIRLLFIFCCLKSEVKRQEKLLNVKPIESSLSFKLLIIFEHFVLKVSQPFLKRHYSGDGSLPQVKCQ